MHSQSCLFQRGKRLGEIPAPPSTEPVPPPHPPPPASLHICIEYSTQAPQTGQRKQPEVNYNRQVTRCYKKKTVEEEGGERAIGRAPALSLE
jgi:hypothetical protein